jgi:hypothetical protein
LVALWTDVVTAAPRAIHRRPISPDGAAVAHWRGLGPTAGCVIRLWPNEEVNQGLVLGEGVETVLAAATRVQHKATLLQPAWAAGDAGHVACFPVLPGIDSLTLLVDNDPSGTGQRAAADCAHTWTIAGREVVRLTPRVVSADFNDILIG